MEIFGVFYVIGIIVLAAFALILLSIFRWKINQGFVRIALYFFKVTEITLLLKDIREGINKLIDNQTKGD